MIMLTFMPNEGHDSKICDYMCMISDVMVAIRVRKCGRWLKTSPYPSPQETIAPELISNTYTSNHANSRHNEITYHSPSGLPGPTAAVTARAMMSILAAMSAPTRITAVPGATIIALGWSIPQLVTLVML